ncbi:MAG: AMP-dependent synthetase [Sulfobacillus thermosulfidooxidans]|nr:MAG: AMP-dependent synthetase [Sulfobacillus thermosulfidooxidans]
MDQFTIPQVLREASDKYPAQGVWADNQFTPYPDLLERVIQLAGALDQIGIRPGDVVGVLDVNSLRHLELHYALAMLKAVIHPLNFRLSLNDLEYTVRLAHDEWLIVGPDFMSLGHSLRHMVPHPLIKPEDIEAHRHADNKPLMTPIHENDPYSLCFTTGTTGRPKATLYRHRDVLLSSWQMVHHLALHDTPARLGMNEVILPLIPFFHMHGWGIPFIAPYVGASVVLAGKISPQEQAALIYRHGVTWSNMVPTQLQALLNVLTDPPTEPLKVLTGGMPITAGLVRRANERHVALSVVYGGADQLAAAISAVPPHTALSSVEQATVLATRLLPLPMVEIRVCDEAGHDVPHDGKSTGELWVKSPWLPSGYWHNQAATLSHYREGYFVSGDLGTPFPDGTIAVIDRLTEAVKWENQWIPTHYLETIISEIEGIDQVAVLPVMSPQWGDKPVAVVQTRQAIDPEMVTAYLHDQALAGRIAPIWVPERIFYITTMPLTSAGKINKADLLAKLDQLPEYPAV